MANPDAPAVDSHQYAFFTVVPEGWSVLLGMLYGIDPVRLLEVFRQHLYRSATVLGLKLEGQLFVALHGAYDPATKTFPVHLHGLARGGMIPIVDGLRDLPKYRRAKPNDGRDAANTPVHISLGPSANMPHQLTYMLKRYWPERETYLDTDGLRKAYGGPTKGIRGPAYAEHLAFLNSWRLEDLTMIMGMRATSKGLVVR